MPGTSRGALVLGALALAGLVAVYMAWSGADNGPRAPGSQPATGIAALARGEVAAFTAKAAPEALPPLEFKDGEGRAVRLADWKGKVVLLNLWATWCAPCRKEMPSLDTLKSTLGGKDFDVVALSTDRGGPEKPRKFLAETGVKSLGLFLDEGGRIPGSIGVVGMPTTLLIDREGREIGRLVGPAEWASPDAVALVKAAIGG